MSRPRILIVLVVLIVLAVTLTGTFFTRGVMSYLPFLQARKGDWNGAYVPHGVVDQRPWQTASTLAALAQSAEEKELARDAERLADHEVDQAFSQSLRQASIAKPNLSGKALALQQRVNELQETIKSDQARIDSLAAPAQNHRLRFPTAATSRSRRRNLALTKASSTIPSKISPAKAETSASSFSRNSRRDRPP